MELALSQLPHLLSAIWWPFCRALAIFSAAPVVGENMVPITVRVLLSLVLAVVLMPVAQPAMPIEPLSLRTVFVTAEQILIGLGIGLAFHLAMSVMMLLGHLISSQMALLMAMMNDPMSGTSSDVVSSLLLVLTILLFFAIDGHLVLVAVVGASFRAWPVGAGVDLSSLQAVAYNVGWIFSAGLLLALPVIFSAFVVQFGFGLLNRVAPTLNLYALGFSALTIFGLLMLMRIVHFLPEHYVRMTGRVLEILRLGLR